MNMKKKTFYHIVLDQSGSMAGCRQSTIASFNEQLQKIKSLQEHYPEQEIFTGLTRFNQEVMYDHFAQHADLVSELNFEMYRPDGMTALYDAIGLTVIKLQGKIEKELMDDTSTVVVVIITDGHENSSRYFELFRIKNMIKELEATGKWTF